MDPQPAQPHPADVSNIGDSAAEIARDIHTIQNIQAVPTLLEVLCESTGMRFAAVARVTEKTWTACAIKDDLEFGLAVGGQLEVESTLCIESKRALAPIVIEHATLDPRYARHHTTRRFNIESYVSVPIVLANGRYFGNLCALDPAPAKVADPRVLSMFKKFAALIALQLESDSTKEEIQQALRTEQTNSELRDQFIAILGHDLRNPLQAIFATGELLERRSTDPALKSIAARVRVNARRMSVLIDDVLDFARGRLGGGIAVKIDSINDLNAGLNAVVKEFQDAQPHRQLVSAIGVTATVDCDLGRIQQVASNLIGNALAHGAPTSPVKITALTDQGHFILDVWNAGEPIPASSIKKIFDPFWRHSTAANRQGLGLGLHICSQIVRAHGGVLSVTSTRDGGTNFTARLPLTARRS